MLNDPNIPLIYGLEGGRRRQYLWAPVVANLTVGVSLGLPLFRDMRAAELDASRP